MDSLSLGFAFLFAMLMDSSCYCTAVTAGCRNLYFMPRIENKALKGHVIKAINASNEGHCQAQCYMDERCVSYNLGPLIKGLHLCELSDSDDILHHRDLEKKQGYLFHAAENPCNNHTCPGVNTTCLTGYTERGFACKCAKEFTGNLCDQDVDECTKKTHQCHPYAVCFNTYGSYKCECKDDFTGDGFKCSAKYKNCQEILKNSNRGSGIYAIDPDGQGIFEVRCNKDVNGGGFTLIQKRFDGSENFYLGWDEYKNGFGQLDGEFWLGLDKIHRLTSQTSNELEVSLRDWDDNWYQASYGGFHVDGEENDYRMTFSSFLGGSAGDSLSYHNGMAFSSKDRNNDESGGSCSQAYHGAWWYKHCHWSNLNGAYHQGGQHSSYADGINWSTWKGYYYSAKFSRLMIRPS